MEYPAGYCTIYESRKTLPPLEIDSSSESSNNDTPSPSKMLSSDNAHESPHLAEKDSDNSNTLLSAEANI